MLRAHEQTRIPALSPSSSPSPPPHPHFLPSPLSPLPSSLFPLPSSSSPHTHHQDQSTRSVFPWPPCVCSLLRSATMMPERDGATSGRRRRDRQLRAFRCDEQLTVRMELAAVLHHSAQRPKERVVERPEHFVNALGPQLGCPRPLAPAALCPFLCLPRPKTKTVQTLLLSRSSSHALQNVLSRKRR